LIHTETRKHRKDIVMAALVAATHDLCDAWVFMGGRDKAGHDEGRELALLCGSVPLCESLFRF
jgi:hypothetical protein